MRRRPRAFSLVELLVVIAILAMLMAILVPVLGRARETARSAMCASNVRQLFLATLAYASDNRLTLPPAHYDITTTNLHRWHGTRKSAGDPFDFEGSPLRHYLQTPVIKQCPSFEPQVPGFEQSAGGYGYNDYYLGSSVGILGWSTDALAHSAKISMIRHPAETIAFADVAKAIPQVTEYSFVEPPLTTDGKPNDPSMHFRHNSRANVVWLDGHVSLEAMQWTYPKSKVYKVNNAAFKLGFIGPSDNSLFDRN